MSSNEKVSSNKRGEHFFYAQVYSLVSGGVIRVQFYKGDKVKELINVAVKKLGINRKGLFPALVIGEFGYQLRLNDEIPTDAKSFVEKHESEFAFDEYEAKERGLKKFRQYGEMIEEELDEIDGEWDSDDIHIALVDMLTGG